MNKWSFSKNIAIAGILCLSIGFLSFAGPGEDYKKKLDAENPVKETVQNISVSSEVQSDSTSDPSVSTENQKDERISAALSASQVGKKEEQILLLLDHKLSLWDKKEGQYVKLKEWECGYGRNGLKAAEIRKEGDGTTPKGAFPISFAFGFAEKENTKLPYRQIKKNSVWSDEKGSYNQWVESNRYVSGEQLWNYKICYEKALAIGFNQDPVVYGRGSAIFLHIKAPDTWESSGCVTVEKSSMEELLTLVNEKVSIMILQNEEEIKAY